MFAVAILSLCPITAHPAFLGSPHCPVLMPET